MGLIGCCCQLRRWRRGSFDKRLRNLRMFVYSSISLIDLESDWRNDSTAMMMTTTRHRRLRDWNANVVVCVCVKCQANIMQKQKK